MNNQKGFVNIVLITAIVVFLGVVGYLVVAKKPEPIVQEIPNPTPVEPKNNSVSPTPAPDKTADYKTYTNTQYKFGFKYSASLELEIMPSVPFFVSALKPTTEQKSCVDTQTLDTAQCIFALVVSNGTGDLSKLGKPSTIKPLIIGGKQATSIITGTDEQLISIPFSDNKYLAISYALKFKNSVNDKAFTDILNSFVFTK